MALDDDDLPPELRRPLEERAPLPVALPLVPEPLPGIPVADPDTLPAPPDPYLRRTAMNFLRGSALECGGLPPLWVPSCSRKRQQAAALQSAATRSLLALLILPLMSGCPANRTAEPTLHGSPMPLPPAMHAPAPPALAIFTKLRGPESVLYDPAQDVYFISNINGAMQSVDGNGFISRVDAATLGIDPKWIESGRNGVRLDGPKGMAILGDALYVADITVVRKFDRRNGAVLGEIAIDGASFLNDIATDGTRLYVSDTGIVSGPGNTFFDSGSDAIWTITNDRAEKLAGGAELRHPNGLDWVAGKLRVVTFRGNELYELDGGRKHAIARTPRGQLDGIVHLADGTALVSSWMGNEIFRVPHRGDASAILAGIAAPADLGYDTKRRHLLVPRPTENQVTVHAVD